jgi:hypothetical protein
MLRRDQLCPGPGECGDVLMENPFANASTPRCEECPLTLLDGYMGSASGLLVQRTIELEFALQAGVTIGLDEISYPEFLLLRSLAQERNRLSEEMMKRT